MASRASRLESLVFLTILWVGLFMGSIPVSALVVEVQSPTGIPEIDWANIQSALDLMPPGGVVMLAPGRYRVHRTLAKPLFEGTLRGAGKDLTVVEATTGSNGELFPSIPMYPASDQFWSGVEFWGTPLFFFESKEEVRIQDISMQVVSLDIAEDSFYAYPDGSPIRTVLCRQLLSFVEIVATEDCRTALERVEMQGVIVEEAYFDSTSPRNGAAIWANVDSSLPLSIGGHHVLESSRFQGIQRPYINYGGRSSIVTVGGDRKKENLFRDCPLPVTIRKSNGVEVDISYNSVEMASTGFCLRDLSDTSVLVSRNQVSHSGGVFFQQVELGLEESIVLIENNDFQQESASAWSGVELYDFSTEKTARVTVVSNTFHSHSSLPGFGPILALGAKGTVIKNNRFSGQGAAAISVGWYHCMGYAENLVILGNNLQRWNTSKDPSVPEIAPIWLGEWSASCVVVGGPNHGNVFDEGIGNLLVGVNNNGTAMGPEVREAMTLLVEAKSRF